MDKMQLVAVVFQSIPEEMVLFALGLTVIGERIKIKKLIIASTFTAFLTYFVRMLPFPFGAHTIIGILTVFFIFNFFFEVRPLPGIIATFSSVGALLTAENLIALPILSALGFHSFQSIWSNTVLRIIVTWPHLILLGAVTYFLYVKKITIIKTSTGGLPYEVAKEKVHGKR